MRFERIATTAGSVPSVRGPSITLPTAGPPPRRSPSRARRPGRVASDRAGTVRLQVLDLVAPWVVGAGHAGRPPGHRGHRPHRLGLGPVRQPPSPASTSTHGRPQPPGYWLYVEAGRLVHGTGLGTVAVPGARVGPGLGPGRRPGGGGRSGPRRPVGRPGRRRARRHVALRLVQRVDRGHLLVRPGRGAPADHPGLAGPPALLARGRRPGRPRPGRRVPAVGAAAVRPPGPGRGGRLDPAGPRGRWSPWPPEPWPSPHGSCRWPWPSRAAPRRGPRPPGPRAEGALQATSVLDHAAGGSVNLGTFAAYTSVALRPLAALALVAAAGLGVRALVRRVRATGRATGHAAAVDPAAARHGTRHGTRGPGPPAASLGRLDTPVVPVPDGHPGGRHRPPDGRRGPRRSSPRAATCCPTSPAR